MKKMKFSKFMASWSGRLLRIVVGAVLIAVGLGMASVWGYVIAVIGIIPFLAGLFDWCLIAPLLKMPLSGKAIRTTKEQK
jgi:hypothetical protein